MNPEAQRGTKYLVHTGSPSWHQIKAGHISAGVTEFDNLEDAEMYLANCKKYRPNEPSFIQKVGTR